MTERQKLNELLKQLKAAKVCHVVKIGDTFGGHKKPYDGYIVRRGRFVAFEAKKNYEPLLPHQYDNLMDAVTIGGALGVVVRFLDDTRNATLFAFTPRGEQTIPFMTLLWERGEYPQIRELPFLVFMI